MKNELASQYMREAHHVNKLRIGKVSAKLDLGQLPHLRLRVRHGWCSCAKMIAGWMPTMSLQNIQMCKSNPHRCAKCTKTHKYLSPSDNNIPTDRP